MDEKAFDQQADLAFAHIEAVLETVDDGLDYELLPGGVLEIEFEDGAKMIINRHRIAQEIWVAARSGGFHFRWSDTGWLDTRTGENLMAKLSTLVSDQAGSDIRF